MFIYVIVMVVIEVSVFRMGVRRVLGEAGRVKVGRYKSKRSALTKVSAQNRE